MSILLIGGHERMEKIYIDQGKEKGIRIKVLGKMKTHLEKRIGNPDAIVIFTNTVSHKMVIAAEQVAKKRNLEIIKCHTSSQNALESVLCDLQVAF